MPDSIRIEICKFDGCQKFDIRACGDKLEAVEMGVLTGPGGSKSVLIIDPKETASDMAFTIKKAMGDVNIFLPMSWTCFTTATSMDEMDCAVIDEHHFARVTCEKDDRRFDIGFVDSPTLTINFRKVAKAV